MEQFARLSLKWLTCLGLLLASAMMSNDMSAFEDARLEFFEKEVRPILVARCFECHSGGKGTPKGGLRLDSRDAILQGGDTGPAVTLDQPSASLFVSVINYGDMYQMPPKSKLPIGEIAVLTKWVELGIPWPQEVASAAGTVKPFDLATRTAEHWCWQPLREIDVPAIAQTEWPISVVDRFILAKLEFKGLQPSPPADKRALLRRVYFDLVGLPPALEEVEEFVQDLRPQALEDVVDRLLGSVHFGERWGRHWLDLTRYAETRGHEFEPIIPNAWQYRDYVIRALNSDVPYDRFLTEQIAGDLTEPRWRVAADQSSPPALPINESVLGTGFWFLGEEAHSPVDIRKDETDRIDNRLDVLSKTFLGLTVACARCHDHKFDAISQRDYYALAGFAIGGSYRQVRVETDEQHRQVARQLDELRVRAQRETAKEVVDRATPVLDQLDLYWCVAQQALDDGLLIAELDTSGSLKSPAAAKIVDRLATENRLDANRLSQWCAELKLAKNDRQHPLHGLFGIESSDRTRRDGQTSDIPTAIVSPSKLETLPGLVVDFGDPDFGPPIQDGVSFGLRPVERGRLVIDGTPERPQLHVATVGGWERDMFWKNDKLAPGTEVDQGTLGTWQPYGRMVRTPEFTLTSTKVWYLVRGSVRAYATVNSHLLIAGPLHASLLQEFPQNDDQWHWVSHGLELYRDHRMHVEFSPANDGRCSIAMVVQGDEQPKLLEPNWSWLEESVTKEMTVAQRAAAYLKVFRQAVDSLIDEHPYPPLGQPTGVGRDIAIPDVPSKPAPVATRCGISAAGRAQLADWFVAHRSLFSLNDFERTNSMLYEAEATLAKQVQWDSTLAPAMLDGNGVDEYLLVRGNSNTPKDPVARRFLEAFQNFDRATPSQENRPTGSGPGTEATATSTTDSTNSTTPVDSGSGRLELAREILRSPLAARVAVNRVWHHLFGRGIVPTVDNLGVLGLPPSHPELLDHLATRFVREGWSMKSLIRSLILSRTYQMSSHPTAADAFDPHNELWHRMPLKRLEGEAIRDSLLAVSGRLDRTPFGPSIPIHLTEFMQGRGRPGVSGPLDGNGRRSIYIAVRRNFLSPMMLAFDTPSPFSTVGRRTVSNVPAQALILMNDPLVIELAQCWADRLLADSSLSNEQRLERLYLTAFGRTATHAETSAAIRFLDAQCASHPESQRQAWGNLCHVMFNVKEFLFIE